MGSSAEGLGKEGRGCVGWAISFAALLTLARGLKFHRLGDVIISE
jgi:hypothetical protein